MGSVHQQQGDWDDASDSYENAEDLMPGLADIHSRWPICFIAPTTATRPLPRPVPRSASIPAMPKPTAFLGLGLYATGKYSAAVHAFQESLARQPNNADVYYDMGITLRDKGNVDAAAAAYRKAIALNPELWEAHNNLGMLFHDLKSYDGAIAEYREAKRLAPEESSVRNNLGNTYCDKGDYDAAITEFRELFAWIPAGSGVTAVWLGRSCPSATMNRPIAELKLAILAESHEPRRAPLSGTSPPSGAPASGGRARTADRGTARSGLCIRPSLSGNGSVQPAKNSTPQKPNFGRRFACNLRPTTITTCPACLMSMGRYDAALTELDTAARLGACARSVPHTQAGTSEAYEGIAMEPATRGLVENLVPGPRTGKGSIRNVIPCLASFALGPSAAMHYRAMARMY